MNDKLTNRIRSGLETVKKWEDKQLLKECRDQIPFHLICPEQFHLKANSNESENENIHSDSPYAAPDDDKYEGDDLFLKRLTKHFQDMMTWVNNPPCELCGSTNTKLRNMRGPISAEEREGQAGRVEVYWCSSCNAETTLFPRYNSPKKLLETKRGRCGEYANLFGLYCRAVGFETRYILDYTDHVWTEVYSDRLGRWIMADSCEGTIDAPSMYEKGWGKNLNCILAFTTESVTDVTRRYSRKFRTEEFQDRRRQICASEIQAEMIVAQFNESIWASNTISNQRVEELKYRRDLEQNFLNSTENRSTWDENEYCEGRQSGSLEWRISRGEAGKMTNGSSRDDNDGVTNDGAATSTVVELNVNWKKVEDPSKLPLRCEDNVVPSNIAIRLPDEYMNFDSQKDATFSAKKDAFLKYVSDKRMESSSIPFIGFCTRNGSPVYLLEKNAYPFRKCVSNTKYRWKTYHFVPESLAGDEPGESDNIGNFPVPVDVDFFTEMLGDRLAKKVDGDFLPISIEEGLQNAQLVAFYFSAHWCPPCRQFTPMLVELYNILKESFPTHGLECIFVSSDRDELAFNAYYGSMPWMALPFSNRSQKAALSARFGVQGIPSLVVLDTISGNIVVSKEICRTEVINACRHADSGILEMFKAWLGRVPDESKEMMETLKLSCAENTSTKEIKDMEPVVEPSKKVLSKEEQKARIGELFKEFVTKGVAPQKAALAAIKQVTDEVALVKENDDTVDMDIDEDNSSDESQSPFNPTLVSKDLVALALRSIENVEKSPSNVRFRSVKLSNKVFDLISRTNDGLRLLRYLGFDIYNADVDYVASIPRAANLSLMKKKTKDLMRDE